MSAFSENAALISSGGGVAAHLAHEVHHRAGDHGRADGDAVELAVQLGDHEPDRLGGAGGGGDQVDRRRARAPEVAVRRVLEALIRRVGVDRGHDPALDAHGVVQHARHRAEAVGGARRVRDHVVALGVVGVVVHAQHERHVGLRGGRRDDHLLRAGLQVLGGVRALREEAGGLDHHVRAHVAPGQRGGVALLEHAQLLAVHHEAVGGRLHVARERPEDRVVLEEVRQRLVVGDVVHADPVDVGAAGVRRPEDVAADAAEAVDACPQGHSAVPFC